MGDQRQWAEQLTEARQRAKKTSVFLLNEKQEIKKELRSAYAELIIFAREKKYEKTELLFFEIIKQLARLTTLSMEESDMNGKLTAEKAKAYAYAYSKKCIRLATALDSILDAA